MPAIAEEDPQSPSAPRPHGPPATQRMNADDCFGERGGLEIFSTTVTGHHKCLTEEWKEWSVGQIRLVPFRPFERKPFIRHPTSHRHAPSHRGIVQRHAQLHDIRPGFGIRRGRHRPSSQPGGPYGDPFTTPPPPPRAPPFPHRHHGTMVRGGGRGMLHRGDIKRGRIRMDGKEKGANRNSLSNISPLFFWTSARACAPPPWGGVVRFTYLFWFISQLGVISNNSML